VKIIGKILGTAVFIVCVLVIAVAIAGPLLSKPTDDSLL
jgi:hypothetical protein